MCKSSAISFARSFTFKRSSIWLSRRIPVPVRTPRARLAGIVMARHGACRTMTSTTASSDSSTIEEDSAVINPIPAAFLRGGTSKGIFIHRKHLPSNMLLWDPIFLRIMGSPDAEYGRQLNGMGGGVSSLSKICVLDYPTEAQKAEGIDVQYIFAQIPIRDTVVDYSGNCGNLSSMIGVCAVDFGICEPKIKASRTYPGSCGLVRSLNVNTWKIIDTTFPISDTSGVFTPDLDIPQAAVAGVPGKASRIDMEIRSPGGARTGRLLPTGQHAGFLSLQDEGYALEKFRTSLVDAANPTVFVLTEDLKIALGTNDVDFTDSRVEKLMEALRSEGAVSMGLNPFAKAQPKICALDYPGPESDADIVARAYSMGVLHKAIPMTVGLCLGVAARLKGTIAWDIISQREGALSSVSEPFTDGFTKIQHASGIVEVGATFSENGDAASAAVVRTGRRLMRGEVWW